MCYLIYGDAMIDKTLEMNLLYDFYGALLPEKQQEILRLHYEEDYSLAEIADEVSITRQGVHDAMKKADRSLHQYEEKLGLVGRSKRIRQALAGIDDSLAALQEGWNQDPRLHHSLETVRDTIRRIQEDQ